MKKHVIVVPYTAVCCFRRSIMLALYCTFMSWPVLNCTALQYITLNCTVLHCTALYCNAL